jgi:hypothetical protein
LREFSEGHAFFEAGPYTGFFHKGGSKAYMPKKVPNIQRIINDILKIVNTVFSGGGGGGARRCFEVFQRLINPSQKCM